MGVHLVVDGEELKAKVTQHAAGRWSVQTPQREVSVTCDRIGDDSADVLLDGRAHRVWFAQHGDNAWLHIEGRQHTVVDTTRTPAAPPGAAGGDGSIRASMNGRVVAVLVEVGQKVQAKQPLVTLEAMKMEHVHAAAVAGTVKAVHVVAGEQVQAGRVLVELENPGP